MITVVDDFLPTHVAESIRSILVSHPQDFQDTSSPVEPGVVYPNTCQKHQPFEACVAGLSALHGGRPVSVKMSCFRLGLLGELDDTPVHVDNIYGATHAAVWYLTAHTRVGGTAFYTHRKTGLDNCPGSGPADLPHGADPVAFHTWLTQECQSAENFTLSGFVGSKFNRLVSYPTSQWHSRVPNNITAPFGRTVVDGRLVWVAFYSVG